MAGFPFVGIFSRSVQADGMGWQPAREMADATWIGKRESHFISLSVFWTVYPLFNLIPFR
jgi:hypothetical protein